MSLVNDALKKARMEAARGDAANRKIPYPLLGRGEQSTSGIWIVALGAVVLLAGIGGFFLYRAGKQSALQEQVVEQRPTSGVESASVESPGDESMERSRPNVQPAPSRASSTQSSLASPASDGKNSTAPAAEPRPPTAKDRPRPEPATPEPAATPPRPSAPQGTTRAGTQTGPPDAGAAEMVPILSTSSAAPTPSRTPAASDERPALADPDATGTTSGPGEPPRPAPVREAAAIDIAPQEFLQRADIPGIGSVELGGIAWSGDRPFALVNGRVVRPGDTVSGLVVDDIQPNTVRLRGDNGTLVFRLK